MNIEVHRTSSPRTLPDGPLGFGLLFTDHAFRMDYGLEAGWHSPRIEPLGPPGLSPAASALHYAQAIFEGLKAFHGEDGKIRLFRPDRHAERFFQSAEKLCIPPLPPELFLEAVEHLVAEEASWVPSATGTALYIRPFAFASEPFLGVRPAHEYIFSIICSPVGAYYARGFEPVRIWVERTEVRAAPGGLGDAKTPANYAASLHAATMAKKRGYDQVLWTNAVSHRFIEEVGTMNVFVHLGDEVVTPSLDGTILPGVTRDSVLTLLRERGVNVVERRLSLEELREAHAKGELHEVFGTGTAAVVSPVGFLGFEDGDITIGDGGPGPLSRSLFEAIVAIQYGRTADERGWTRVVAQ